MRTRTAATVVAVAAVLGTLIGAFLLPDHQVTKAGERGSTALSTALTPSASASTSGSPSTSGAPSSSPSETAKGPVTKANLLKTSDFTQLGLDVTAQSSDDSRINVPSCPTQRENTMAKLAGSGTPLQRVWDGGSVRAYQEAVTLDSAEEARAVVSHVVRLLESCQQMPPRHFVSGPTHFSEPEPGVTAAWVGIVAGELNVTGKAPDDPTQIAGGMGVVRNGLRVAVLDLNLCNSGGEQVPCTVGKGDPYEQLDTLTNAAALRLG